MLETFHNVHLCDKLSCSIGGAIRGEYTNGMFGMEIELLSSFDNANGDSDSIDSRSSTIL